jgi:hypothetical protein
VQLRVRRGTSVALELVITRIAGELRDLTVAADPQHAAAPRIGDEDRSVRPHGNAMQVQGLQVGLRHARGRRGRRRSRGLCLLAVGLALPAARRRNCGQAGDGE